MTTYKDPLIECSETGVRIHRYYPWGSKQIPYASIQSLERFKLSPVRGKYRIWGTGTFRTWANLDPSRPKKDIGFYLNLGHPVRPVVTPDDPDAFEAVVTAHLPSGRTG